MDKIKKVILGVIVTIFLVGIWVYVSNLDNDNFKGKKGKKETSDIGVWRVNAAGNKYLDLYPYESDYWNYPARRAKRSYHNPYWYRYKRRYWPRWGYYPWW